MEHINITFTKTIYEYLNQENNFKTYEYNYYSENFTNMYVDLKCLFERFSEPFNLSITFEMEDELSFNLFHECLKYLYQQDNRYNNILFITGLISEENFQQNDSCKLSADVLHKANGHLLFNVDLFYIDKSNNIVIPSNLSGEMLSEELFNIYNTIEKITDPILVQMFKLNTLGPSNVIDLRNTLIKLFKDPIIFNAITDKKNEIIINTTKSSMEKIQNEYKSLVNSYRAARIRMEYSINSLFFSKIFSEK